jgi:4-amino-4-deoxy-L-arabinose transferase-like glycosyltransferase
MATSPLRQSRLPRIVWVCVAALLALVLCRLWAAGTLPLTDTTEARFSEMARKMVETGDWLVPQHDYGVPYLAKPPLAMWLAAIGIELFGPDEFGPRAPILAWTLAFCALFYYWASATLGRNRALVGTLIQLSAFVFFMSAAAVMTDMILTTCVAAALMGFWRRQHGGSVGWEIGLYVAVGLGLLAKGPLTIVLVFVPIVGWSLWTRRSGAVWRRFAWLRGAALAAIIAVPWYVAAEIRNPGFLNYFIVGEHIGRFLIPDWSGDLYGRAHEVPRGTIWVFYIIGMLPWPVLLAPALIGSHTRLHQRWNENRQFLKFLLLWAGTPLALFTFSANIIFPYALPAVPGTATLLAVVAARDEGDTPQHPALHTAWLAALMIVLGTAWLLNDDELIDAHTQKNVVARIQTQHREAGYAIYYWRDRHFSAEYYSQGAAKRVDDAAVLQEALDERRPFSLVVREDRLDSVPAPLRSALEPTALVDGFAILEPTYEQAASSGRLGLGDLARR